MKFCNWYTVNAKYFQHELFQGNCMDISTENLVKMDNKMNNLIQHTLIGDHASKDGNKAAEEIDTKKAYNILWKSLQFLKGLSELQKVYKKLRNETDLDKKVDFLKTKDKLLRKKPLKVMGLNVSYSDTSLSISEEDQLTPFKKALLTDTLPTELKEKPKHIKKRSKIKKKTIPQPTAATSSTSTSSTSTSSTSTPTQTHTYIPTPTQTYIPTQTPKPKQTQPPKPTQTQPLKPTQTQPLKPTQTQPLKLTQTQPLKSTQTQPIKPTETQPLKPTQTQLPKPIQTPKPTSTPKPIPKPKQKSTKSKINPNQQKSTSTPTEQKIDEKPKELNAPVVKPGRTTSNKKDYEKSKKKTLAELKKLFPDRPKIIKKVAVKQKEEPLEEMYPEPDEEQIIIEEVAEEEEVIEDIKAVIKPPKPKKRIIKKVKKKEPPKEEPKPPPFKLRQPLPTDKRRVSESNVVTPAHNRTKRRWTYDAGITHRPSKIDLSPLNMKMPKPPIRLRKPQPGDKRRVSDSDKKSKSDNRHSNKKRRWSYSYGAGTSMGKIELDTTPLNIKLPKRSPSGFSVASLTSERARSSLQMHIKKLRLSEIKREQQRKLKAVGKLKLPEAFAGR